MMKFLSRGIKMTLEQMLKQWNDPHEIHDIQDAEEIIHALQVELAGKNSLIDMLHDDMSYYRKDWKDQMIQDQGLPEQDPPDTD